jgi:hypothetical protein
MKNLLSISRMINLQCVAEFDDQQLIITKCNHNPGRVLAIGLHEAGVYKLLADPVKHGALVHKSDNLYELWHKQFVLLCYGALPLLKDMV